MSKQLKYHKNHTEFGEPYQLILPLNLGSLIRDDDFVQLLSHELDDLDYKKRKKRSIIKVRQKSERNSKPKEIFSDFYAENEGIAQSSNLMIL